MFESLSDKLSKAMKSLRGQARLTEKNIEDALREVRMALLEADVHVQVTKAFLAKVKEKAVGAEVLNGLNPTQAFVDIVYQELTAIMGGTAPEKPLDFAPKPPTIVMMVGLQGAGKTTTCGKLACFLKKNGNAPLLVPADVYRPAAIEQLHVVAKEAGVPSYRTDLKEPVAICRAAVEEARLKGWDVVILDTAGRLHLDDAPHGRSWHGHPRAAVTPDRDPLRGRRHDRPGRRHRAPRPSTRSLAITGVVLTKMDGDARGGAALSASSSVTGQAASSSWACGEKLSDLEPFHPDRAAQRILGMGDVLTLIEQAKEKIDEGEAERMTQRLLKNQFTLEDMLNQMRQVQKLGSMQKIMGMIPGMGQLKEQLETVATDKRMKHLEAILTSMTPAERKNHLVLDGKRKRRIAAGSGRPVHEVNRLLKQYLEMKKMMSQMNDPKFMKRMQAMAGKMGGGMPGMPKLPGGGFPL